MLVTYYTDSHSDLLKNYFLKSYICDYNDVYIKKFNQDCPSGEFGNEGWHLTMINKFKLLASLSHNFNGNTIVFSDCDVIIVKPSKLYLENELKNYDIVFQRDDDNYVCAGFFTFKCNEKMCNFFKFIINKITSTEWNEQLILNRSINNFDIKYNILNPNIICNCYSQRKWVKDPNIKLPTEMIVFHANYIKGIENKKNILNRIIKSVSN